MSLGHYQVSDGCLVIMSKLRWDCGSVRSVVGTFDDLTFLPELSNTLILPIIKILLAAVKLVFGFRSQITKVNRDHVPVCKV